MTHSNCNDIGLVYTYKKDVRTGVLCPAGKEEAKHTFFLGMDFLQNWGSMRRRGPSAGS